MDLNTASIPAMAKCVGLARAHDIFLWRPFLSWAEVERIPELTGEQLARLRQAGAQVKLPDEPLTRRETLDARLSGVDRGRGHDDATSH
jgi:hypothetical protein